MKIVINDCFGGFSISEEAKKYCEENSSYNISRTNEKLIEFIEKYGSERASGMCAKLKIVEIPDDVNWEIEEYDGNEWVAEVHRTWE